MVKQHDLKTILAQIQAFDIPGFSQLIGDLKDPLLPVHLKSKMKSIDHNIHLLKERLQTMQAVFQVQPDEVNRYMSNKDHFSEQEMKTFAQVESQLTDYWRQLTKDLTDQSATDKKNSTSKDKGVKRAQAGPKPQGGRRGWIAT